MGEGLLKQEEGDLLLTLVNTEETLKDMIELERKFGSNLAFRNRHAEELRKLVPKF